MVKLEVIGHLGKDAEVNNYNGKNVINFSVAHSEKYKDANGTTVNKSVWVDCAYWVDSTAVAQCLKKGTQVYVEGQPEARPWKDKNGNAQASLTCRVRKIELLGRSNRENNSHDGQSNESNSVQQYPTTTQESYLAPSQVNGDNPADDLPF